MILVWKLSVSRDPPLTCMSVSTTSPCFPWIALWLSTNKNLAAVLIFCPCLDNLGTMLFATVWSSSVSVLWFSLLCNSPSYAMYAFSSTFLCALPMGLLVTSHFGTRIHLGLFALLLLHILPFHISSMLQLTNQFSAIL